MQQLKQILLMMSVMLSGGCGTIHNFNQDKCPYHGVKTDWYVVSYPFVEHEQDLPSSPPLALLVYPVFVIDLPLSLVADTVTLPITILACEKE